MFAYLLLIVALLSRVIPHSGWYGFTAVGGALLYFGARRGWREMLLPALVLAVSDYYLTAHVYGYPFHAADYAVTWGWYLAAFALGHALLASRVSFARVLAAAVAGPTSFFLLSNAAAWLMLSQAGGVYARNFSGLVNALIAGVPFYERDLISTGLVLTLAFGIPAVLQRPVLHQVSRRQA
ncbi:MAG TPA: DUF6580 family putative transport protein [Acidobacteriaceae bacterium]|nr:DUF6580 family putative transport protein [Acidobacteriaceae bacterium]